MPMKYADYQFYIKTYCDMQNGRLTADEFPFWVRRAEAMLDMITCNNITEVTEAVKLCVCEIAELLYAVGDKGGCVVSENNDGYAVTYAQETVKTVEKQAMDIAKLYLHDTGLLYRGW